MQAIIRSGGKQYSVTEGDIIYVEKLSVEAGDTYTFNEVVAVVDGENSTFGAPLVSGASVSAKVVKNGKNRKITVIKYKPKKGYLRRAGHRQPYTKLQIEKISV